MTFTKHLNVVLEAFLDSIALQTSKELIIPCLDLTLLQDNTPKESIIELAALAQKHQVAALCIYPDALPLVQSSLSVQLATVINFPQSLDAVSYCINQIDQAKHHGAQEIDYVFPYKNYLEGKQKQALEHASDIINHCKSNQLTVKVILETGAFFDLEVLYQLAQQLIIMNVDFLKTSTGKIAQGATFSHALALLFAIKESHSECGLKVSGGIRTCNQAQQYAYLAQLVLQKELNNQWFRIGASTLLNELLKTH